ISNRKVLEGFYLGLGLADPLTVMQIVDKLDKVPRDDVHGMLAEAGLNDEQARACLDLASINTADGSHDVADAVRELGVHHPTLDAGLDELEQVRDAAQGADSVDVVVDLRIARGLDYYTGTVFETRMRGYEQLGSICSGGRYDTLASDGRNTYPGVGISLGVSRLLVPLIADGLTSDRSVPSAVLVAVSDETTRDQSNTIAHALRSPDRPCEVAASAHRFGKPARYAGRRGIRSVSLTGRTAAGHHGTAIRSREQYPAGPPAWAPPANAVRPRIEA